MAVHHGGRQPQLGLAPLSREGGQDIHERSDLFVVRGAAETAKGVALPPAVVSCRQWRSAATIPLLLPPWEYCQEQSACRAL